MNQEHSIRPVISRRQEMLRPFVIRQLQKFCETIWIASAHTGTEYTRTVPARGHGLNTS